MSVPGGALSKLRYPRTDARLMAGRGRVQCAFHPFGPAVANDMRTDLGLLRALQIFMAAAAHDQRYPARAKEIPQATKCLARYCCFAACMTDPVKVSL
ncbi:hypothetical protein MPLA_1600014 [Mesorhizobium sp. ORS 3359]|nr:hypothetical protein MPLA_1600014 [Mesorhizobium sp. ORS 3359]